jgi:hypothetical protein
MRMYAIKFGSPVSQKEIEKKLLDDGTTTEGFKSLHRMSVRIELIGAAEDIKAIDEFLKHRQKH